MIKRLSKGIVAPPQKKFLYGGQALYRLGEPALILVFWAASRYVRVKSEKINS